ncbi:hypothetical protein IC229_34095 [Spirosoma sp. BT702]|uniref:Histidine kinase n=1 Tax=Spirosoma profusum TaxID=2771354 RepID=A0A927AWF6_9BACT|nr:sensor histidine kinase [Spirosoma profusum]MBD2705690.1 hypothetical protein [Spirosoma profusum]
MKALPFVTFWVVLYGLSSCRPHRQPAHVPLQVPTVVEAKGRVVPKDSIQLPIQIPIRSPKLVKAGKPKVVILKAEGYSSALPPQIPVGNPTICVAGQHGYSLPKRVTARKHIILAGIPEKILSKAPASKDHNPKNITTFGLEHGLKNLNISEVVQDKLGNLWIATGFGGVARYDGKTFAYYTEREGLSNNTVLSILKDSHGNLWFGTQLGASRFDGKYFTNYTVNDGLPANIVNEIIEDKRGNIWFATYGGITRLDIRQNVLTHFTVNEGLPFNLANRIFEDSHGTIWTGTYQHGLSSLTIDYTTHGETYTFKNYTKKEGLPGDNVLAIAEDHDGSLWVGTDEGVGHYTPASDKQKPFFRHFNSQNGLPDNTVNSLLIDKRSRVLIGTENGIAICESVDTGRSSRFTYLTEADGLPHHGILSLFDDANETIWVGTERGLSKYSFNAFTLLTEKDGIPDKLILAIIEDKKGDIWLGTYGGGVIKYQRPQRDRPGAITHYTVKEGLSDNVVYALHEDVNGHIWMGTRDGGVTKFSPSPDGNGGTFTHYTEQQGLLSNFVVSILEDRDGYIWFAHLSKTLGGVSKFDGKTFTNFTRAQGLNSRDFWSIAQDKRGDFWFGSWGEGLTKYEPAIEGQKGVFTHFDKRAGLSNEKIRPIWVDARGAVWFGTIGGGINKYEEGLAGKPAQFTQYTEREGLSSNDVRSILEDRNGTIWLGNYYGISKFSPNETQSGKLVVSFTQEDGLLGIGCLTNSICEDRTGKIWIGTLKNLTVFDPSLIRPDTSLPTVQLTDLKLFNEQTSWRTDTTFLLQNGIRVGSFGFKTLSDWYAIPQQLSLPYNNNFITFDFVGINIHTPKTVRYQYQLEGLEDNWSASSSRSEAVYGNLRPGNYVFKIRARNGDGRWGNILNYSFSIRPPWWVTWWAYLLYGLLAAASIYAWIQYRVREGIEKIKAQEAIRIKISSDLHDDVGSILSGLAMQSQLMALTALEEQKEPLGEISAMSHDAMERMRDTVWAIDSRKDKYENLIDRMRAFAERNLNRKRIIHEFDIAIDDARKFIDPQKRQNIYLIFKEAITNIDKHSDATHVRIVFRESNRNLYLLIHDNGTSKKVASTDGLGLPNMQMRATRIGGILRVTNENGFKIELTLA